MDLLGLPRRRKPFFGNEQTANVAENIRDAGLRFFGANVPYQKPQDEMTSMYRLAQMGALLNKQNEPVGGYENETDIPKAVSGLPLSGITTGKTGRLFPRYGRGVIMGEEGEGSTDGGGEPLPEGFKVVGGRVYKDPTYKRQPKPEERQRMINDEIAKKELATMTTNLPKLDQAFQAQQQLKDIYYKGMTPESIAPGDTFGGIMNRLKGPARAFGAAVGTNPNLNRYLANRKAFSGLISKGGFGEAGMLTDEDIKRVVNALPSEYSTEEEAAMGFNEVGKILSAARERFEQKKAQYMNGMGGDESDYSSPEEADASGLPAGTIVTVNGRRYEIG